MALYTQTGALQTYGAVEAAGPGVIVPDAQLLFTGDYSRAGSDLVLTGSDGAKFLVTGYFNTDSPPSLISPDGAKLPADVVMSLAGPQFPGQYAQAGDASGGKQAIGKVESSSGSASAVRADGTTVTLKAGDPVFQGDVVLTGPGSKMGISFVDGTIFSLSANARMVLNSLIYDPDAGQNNSMLFSLVEGSFVFAAGQIAPTGDMKIQTPVATMGIRGTAPTVNINSETGEVNFSIIADPGDGHVGTYTLYNLDNGLPIGTVSSVGTKWQLTSANGQIIEIDKTEADLLNDANAVGQINNIYSQWQNSTQQTPQAGPDNNPPPSGGLNTNPQNPDAPGTEGNTGGTGGEGEGEGQNNNQNNNQQSGSTPPPPTNTSNDTPPPIIDDPDDLGANVINGTRFDDNPLDGTNGNDFIYGHGGNDTITAFAGNDVVNAGEGDDTIIGGTGEGDDTYNGGAGTDTLSYASTSQGVEIDLANGTAFGPEIGNDTFTGIEEFIGGGGRDIFIVTQDGNWLFNGGDNIDTIRIAGDLNIDTASKLIIADSIEIIDLNKTDENILTISADDVVNDDPATILQIRGGANADGTTDTVNLTNDFPQAAGVWHLVMAPPIELDGLFFNVYEFSDSDNTVLSTAHIEQNIEVILPPEPMIMTFDGALGAPHSYTEAGMTVTSLYGNDSGHLHLGNDQISNHSSCCSTPYRFQLEAGKVFDFIGFDVISNFGSGEWTSEKGGSIVAQSVGTHHEFESDPLFQGVTWVEWSSANSSSTIDNVIFVENAPAVLIEGFENSFATNGWVMEGNATISSDNFNEGGSSALLTTTTGNEDNTPDFVRTNALEIANLAGVFPNVLDALANTQDVPGFATEGSAIVNSFFAEAGQTLTFDWFFSTFEFNENNEGIVNDFAFVVIDGEVFELFDAEAVGNQIDVLAIGWNSFSIALDASGQHDITFGVLDNEDTDVESSLNIDNIRLDSGGDIPHLRGGDGNDILVSGLGQNTVTTGAGADRIIFGHINDGIDLITDFGLQDTLDLTGLLNGVFDLNNVDGTVRAMTNGRDTTISVDIDGPGPDSPAGFEDIAILQDIGPFFNIRVSIGDEETTLSNAAVTV